MPDTPTTASKAADAASTASATAPSTPHEPIVQTLLSNPLDAWIVAGSILLALIVVVQFVRIIVVRHFDKHAKRTEAKWDDVLVDVLKKIRFWLILPSMLEAAAQPLHLPAVLDHALRLLTVLGLGIQLLLMAGRIVDAGLEAMARRGHAGEPKEEIDSTIASSLGVARAITMGVIAIVVILFALDNLGVKITPMLTGLGIGGIAVALAVQNILGDLFGSLTIILDKPFVVGDSIQVGDKSGTVERIGIKTTRVRSTTGEELIFTNTDLLTSRVQNFRRMRERRVSFIVQLVYDTPADKLTRMPAIVKAAVEKQQGLRFDRCHFRAFGANGLEFECVYFVLSPEYRAFMDAQQSINLDIMRGCAAEGMQIAPNGSPFARATPAPAASQPQSSTVTLGPKHVAEPKSL
jgi:small-conductance mechanosensitive channel